MRIFSYWHSPTPPPLVARCVRSWERHMPECEICVLSAATAPTDWAELSPAFFSDILAWWHLARRHRPAAPTAAPALPRIVVYRRAGRTPASCAVARGDQVIRAIPPAIRRAPGVRATSRAPLEALATSLFYDLRCVPPGGRGRWWWTRPSSTALAVLQ
jgi:hypothetical protein